MCEQQTKRKLTFRMTVLLIKLAQLLFLLFSPRWFLSLSDIFMTPRCNSCRTKMLLFCNKYKYHVLEMKDKTKRAPTHLCCSLQSSHVQPPHFSRTAVQHMPCCSVLPVKRNGSAHTWQRSPVPVERRIKVRILCLIHSWSDITNSLLRDDFSHVITVPCTQLRQGRLGSCLKDWRLTAGKAGRPFWGWQPSGAAFERCSGWCEVCFLSMTLIRGGMDAQYWGWQTCEGQQKGNMSHQDCHKGSIWHAVAACNNHFPHLLIKSRKLNSVSETWIDSSSSSSNSAASSSSSTTGSGGDDPVMKSWNAAQMLWTNHISIHLQKLTWQVGVQDLLEEFQFFFRFHISWPKYVSLWPHLPEYDKKLVNT